MKRRSKMAGILAAVLSIFLLAAASGEAAPSFGVQLTRSPETIKRGDEFAGYKVDVKNISAESSSGALNVSVDLPPGVTLGAASGSGWGCFVAIEICTNSATVPAAGSYPTLNLSQVWIGDGAPDTVTVKATAVGGGAAVPSTGESTFTFGAREPFGIDASNAKVVDESGADLVQAGGHPSSASVSFKVRVRTLPDGSHVPVEDLHSGVSEIPAGLVGNPSAATASCTFTEMLENKCPDEAAVGGVFVDLASPEEPDGLEFSAPVYRLVHEDGYPASFGFKTPAPSFVVRTKIRSDGDYGITGIIPLVPSRPRLYESDFTFCGYGANLHHDPGSNGFESCKKLSDADHNRKPFVSLATNCTGGKPMTRFAVDSWLHRGSYQANGLPDLTDPTWAIQDVFTPPLTGCARLSEEWTGQHEPSFSFQPDSHAADSPAAYTARVHVPQEGLEDPQGLATSHLRDTTVTLPRGVTFNPAVGDGLAACSESQIGLLGNAFAAPSRIRFDTQMPSCPPNSKVGLATIKTPLLEQSLHGSVYLARQGENPFDSDYAIYLTVEEPETGVIAKLAGKVEPDLETGQIRTTFAENPQVPFNDLTLDFFGGGRAALANPVTCGSFTVNTALTPWSAAVPAAPQADEIARPTDQISIDSGPNGSRCASSPAQRPFDLGFEAGARNPIAGARSPFTVRITRPDGAQELDRLELATPPGFVASLKGIPYCGDGQIAAAAAGSGKAELASPSCPAASAIGTTNSGAGSGPTPFYAAGKLYLAGPYRGAPLSAVAITPAVAGPFDLGNVVIRSALEVDPTTARITAVTDPIPRVVKGIPLRIRDVRIDLDRPDWAQNPTSCEAKSVTLTAFGSDGAIAEPTNRFQVGGCEKLGFGPKLSGSLKGGTKRNDHPAFTSVLTAPEGAFANIASASVALPHSEFLDQSHIRTVCTRVQFAADQCPAGSVYGRAEAISPLLDQPLAGNVYLRSSSNPLPDLVVALKGPASQPIAINLAGRIDSVRGGIRTTFETVPDAPVSRFILSMRGGKKGLLVNSRDLCSKGGGRMTVRLVGQNGMLSAQSPRLKNQCRKGGKHSRHAE
jgi:hypothetical protein